MTAGIAAACRFEKREAARAARAGRLDQRQSPGGKRGGEKKEEEEEEEEGSKTRKERGKGERRRIEGRKRDGKQEWKEEGKGRIVPLPLLVSVLPGLYTSCSTRPRKSLPFQWP